MSRDAVILYKPTKTHGERLKGVDPLAPDPAPGRFTESLTEAAERANKEKDTFTVIIAAGTTSGDGHIREVHTKRLVEQISGKPIIVHVLMYAGEKSATGGDSQIEVGQRITKMTGAPHEFSHNTRRSVNRFAT